MNPEELKPIGVLQALDVETLAGLAAALQEIDLADGQTVFAEGDPGDSMYFILKGSVRIEKRVQGTTATLKTLAVLEAGDYFGEMALLDQKPRSASAVAAGAAMILRLSKASFDRMQAHGGSAAMNVLFAMIQTSSERIRRLSAHLVVYDAVGKAIGESTTLQELLDAVLSQLSGAMLADWGLLVLRSPFSSNLEIHGAVNLQLTAEQQAAIAEGQGFVGAALQEPCERLCADFERDCPEVGRARLGFETPSLVWSAICVDRDVLGLIVLGARPVGQFDLNDLNLLKGVARQAAQAILNARHREEQQARARHARQFVRF